MFRKYILPFLAVAGVGIAILLPLCVIPSKRQRVDTRVLQVIYSFPRGNLPIYIGQQMDVYIDAPTHPLNARVEVAR